MARYKTLSDGERRLIPEVSRGLFVHRLSCCDCKLVHNVALRRVRGGIELTAWRDMRRTAARRRKRG